MKMSLPIMIHWSMKALCPHKSPKGQGSALFLHAWEERGACLSIALMITILSSNLAVFLINRTLVPVVM